MASKSTNKRRRTAADTLHISSLPIGFIVDVSSYLSKPSKAILALAFTSSSLWQNDYEVMHRLSPISKAVISASQWETLDFEDVERELANKLTDNDISAVLKSINAQDVLKRLKLCGCINIIGHGLNPLRGSAVLELLDICFRSKSGKAYFEYRDSTKISLAVTGPILESIITTEGCSLKYIMFPHTWLLENSRRENVYLQDIVRRYNELFSTRDMICSKCNVDIQGIADWLNRSLQNNLL